MIFIRLAGQVVPEDFDCILGTVASVLNSSASFNNAPDVDAGISLSFNLCLKSLVFIFSRLVLRQSQVLDFNNESG